MKKRMIWLLAVALVLSVGVGATIAYLVASSSPVQNTFTVGSVTITLTETTGAEYKILPGATLMKDPAVTVKGGSDDCWVFVKITPTGNFEQYCTHTLRSEWTPLPGEPGVYYLSANGSAVDRIYRILHNDRITVRETLTEEDLKAITVTPTLDFTAYAIQRQGVDTPQAAWQILREEG